MRVYFKPTIQSTLKTLAEQGTRTDVNPTMTFPGGINEGNKRIIEEFHDIIRNIDNTFSEKAMAGLRERDPVRQLEMLEDLSDKGSGVDLDRLEFSEGRNIRFSWIVWMFDYIRTVERNGREYAGDGIISMTGDFESMYKKEDLLYVEER